MDDISNKYIKDRFNEVQIGTQIWMAKNLDVDHYRNGDEIPEVKDSEEWANLTTGAWCYYENDEKNGEIYGKLYNWFAVNDPRGLAPEGWHIATDDEWVILSEYLGGEKIAGGKLKNCNSSQWIMPNEGASNESGFTAHPAGWRSCHNGKFYYLGYYSSWWSVTEKTDLKPCFKYIHYNRAHFDSNFSSASNGFSVRCVKD